MVDTSRIRIEDTGRGGFRSAAARRWAAWVGGGALAIYGISRRSPRRYKIFRDKQDNCTKVVLDPWADGAIAA
jgi:hypothetical protein